jgi:hypothetical protein
VGFFATDYFALAKGMEICSRQGAKNAKKNIIIFQPIDDMSDSLLINGQHNVFRHFLSVLCALARGHSFSVGW